VGLCPRNVRAIVSQVVLDETPRFLAKSGDETTATRRRGADRWYLMSANRYKLWGTSIGSAVGDGVSASVHVGVAAIAKKANAAEPNIVINELACSLVAHALRLPCPPGVLLEHGGETYFCSMNFNLAGHALPPTPVQALLTELPALCWGIILFDVLMLNPDRHKKISLTIERRRKFRFSTTVVRFCR
jgi:hypothetical protein